MNNKIFGLNYNKHSHKDMHAHTHTYTEIIILLNIGNLVPKSFSYTSSMQMTFIFMDVLVISIQLNI